MQKQTNTVLSPQEKIEAEIRKVIDLGNYEAGFLFSAEGLPLVQVSAGSPYSGDELLEIALSLQQAKKSCDALEGFSMSKEISILGASRRKLIFRYFQAFEQLVILAVVVPPGKTYKAYTNRIVRAIQEVGHL